MKLEWSSKYEIGVKSIDEQHKVLVELINKLSDAIETKDRDLCYDSIMGLFDYTMNHFVYEEAIFEQIAYKESNEHREEHYSFTSKIVEVLGEFEAGKPLTGELIPFLNEWLLHHILKVDLAYVPAFKESGIN